jgi:tRNA pseudouridine55 synthase
MVLNINKPLGITSYDVIRQLKKKYPGEKIGHAGTLDPLAEGVLICLIGKQDTKRQSEFMGSVKEYEYEVLFGFETDTYDVLGLVKDNNEYKPDEIEAQIKPNLQIGNIKQKLPPFSASKVRGRPLYRWYLDGRISEVEIPENSIEVIEHKILRTRILSKSELVLEIDMLVNTVNSRFRKDSVLKSWEETLANTNQNKFLIVTLTAKVTKGAYVRALAHDLGSKLKTGACTLTIKRTKVGDFRIENSVKLEDLN